MVTGAPLQGAMAQPVAGAGPPPVSAPAPPGQGVPVVVSRAAQDVFVTVYRDNLALITETRVVDLPGGAARVEFGDVLSTAIPASAIVTGLEDHEAERNFDFDGLTPSSLLRRSVGQSVTAVRTGPGGRAVEEQAVVTAAGAGVVLRYADRWEAAWCAGGPEKLVFDAIPAGLRATPTLSTTLGPQAPSGPLTLTLSYLATGVTWSADYVLTLDAAGRSGSLTGWLTIRNTAQSGFLDARTGVVAGELSRVWPTLRPWANGAAVGRACWPLGNTSTDTTPDLVPPPPPPPPPMPVAAPPAMMAREMADIAVTAAKAEREALGDYQLYVVPSRTSVAARQTKQVAFVMLPSVRFDRLHTFTVFPNLGREPVRPIGAYIELRARNDAEAGLGEPLPRGTVRIMQATPVGALFAGEASTRDVAVDSDWRLQVGTSAAVTTRMRTVSVQRRPLGRQRPDRERVTAIIEHELVNALAQPVTVEVRQVMPGENPAITDRGVAHVQRNGLPTWTVPVAANGRTVLRYELAWDGERAPPPRPCQRPRS